MNKITAIGIMSGTSVDGLDIAAAEFSQEEGDWHYNMIAKSSVSYPPALKSRLVTCIESSGADLVGLDHELGEFIGEQVNRLCEREGILPALVASHGHTVFHRPEKGITTQIGDGQTIFNRTGIRVINDFRKIDVLRGGQGAPLVPVGDKYLFADFEFCLNIGGFSNISFDNDRKERKAYDVGPANIILNYLARMERKEFDEGGKLARSGKMITELFDDLNHLAYFSQPAPKSLGLEWVKENLYPMIGQRNSPVNDFLRTFTEHIAFQINAAITNEKKLYYRNRNCRVLVTGGGAYNHYLLERLSDLAQGFKYIIPGPDIIEFKEALIFAFLGVLRYYEQVNILKSVTGAARDSSAGTIHHHP